MTWTCIFLHMQNISIHNTDKHTSVYNMYSNLKSITIPCDVAWGKSLKKKDLCFNLQVIEAFWSGNQINLNTTSNLQIFCTLLIISQQPSATVALLISILISAYNVWIRKIHRCCIYSLIIDAVLRILFLLLCYFSLEGSTCLQNFLLAVLEHSPPHISI